jgi:hypothetical protein
MADRITTTKTKTDDRINAKLDEVRDLLIASGVDEGTADARLFSARPNVAGGSLVGNFADLQRAGGLIATEKASNFAEGVVVPTAVDAEGNVTLTEHR